MPKFNYFKYWENILPFLILFKDENFVNFEKSGSNYVYMSNSMTFC